MFRPRMGYYNQVVNLTAEAYLNAGPDVDFQAFMKGLKNQTHMAAKFAKAGIFLSSTASYNKFKNDVKSAVAVANGFIKADRLAVSIRSVTAAGSPGLHSPKSAAGSSSIAVMDVDLEKDRKPAAALK